MNEHIKWICFEPLTGGMYLGAEEAIGHPADAIISFKDFGGYIKDSKNIETALNEQQLANYLRKKNRLPNWYIINHDPFVDDNNFNPEFIHPDNLDYVTTKAEPSFKNVDLVVAVPFCSGLSQSSSAGKEHRSMRNCNMVYCANYVINTIKPKIYLFENAPTMMSTRGVDMRMKFEDIARKNGYSVIYYKTNTLFHHNCQRRVRTFILFIKNRNNKPFFPEIHWEYDRINAQDYFIEMLKEIAKSERSLVDDPMNEVLFNCSNLDTNITIPIKYCNHVFGNNWRYEQKCQGGIFDWVCQDKKEQNKFMNWLVSDYFNNVSDENADKVITWYIKQFRHFLQKLAENKGYWATFACNHVNYVPACMYKNIPTCVHYYFDRLYTMREWLWTMGHPVDFDMIGKPISFYKQIGQNVPVRTAKFMVNECLRILNNWNDIESCECNQIAIYLDNTKQKRIF